MKVFELPFSLEIPTQVSNLKIIFFVSDRLYAFGENCASGPHNHGDYELRYTVAGNGIQTVDKSLYPVSAGDLILIRPNEYHYQSRERICSDLEQYSLRFSIKQPLDTATIQQKKSHTATVRLLQTVRQLHDANAALLPLFQMLTQEIAEKKYGYFNCLQAMCVLIFTAFIRLSDTKNPEIFPSVEMKYSGYWRSQIDDFLGFHYMENVKLQDLADAVKLSPRQASRLIMREFGVNYTTKLMETRLERAKYQLTNTDKEIHTISDDCGFQSYNYFTTCFRKFTGMTPSEFREHTKK